MCGIVGAVSQRDVVPMLLDGLSRLEYRGYDSAGLCVVADGLQCVKTGGRVEELKRRVVGEGRAGTVGIAHTRWATHGAPTQANAHPHTSHGLISVVHNGIIENYQALRAQLQSQGYQFVSETDAEVIPHLIHRHYVANGGDLANAVRTALPELDGSYAIAVVAAHGPRQLVCARQGSPLVLGLGEAACFCASDIYALLPFTQHFVHLEDGDVVDLREDGFRIVDRDGVETARPSYVSAQRVMNEGLGAFHHYMHKEIHEQPRALADTIATLSRDCDAQVFGEAAGRVFAGITRVGIVACGSSYHAGLIARHWFENVAQLACDVEIASEYRYRTGYYASEGLLLVLISQSGETADTLGALQHARSRGVRHVLSICNVAESSLARLCDLHFLTRAGPEIGVASTKAFTTQLVALYALATSLALARRAIDTGGARHRRERLRRLTDWSADLLRLEPALVQLATGLALEHDVLFIGRGLHYPVAMEGALKLKEISYLHAEAYAAGELKHGALALVCPGMPVVALAPRDALMEKMQSNMQEVRARGGRLLVFADKDGAVDLQALDSGCLLAGGYGDLSPVPYAVALQLLAYHVAVARGNDVDKPRNLAKSVTVE